MSPATKVGAFVE